jgi:thiol-disulfide isomerase/thioredoxin
VVQEFEGKVRFVSENYGDSKLAKRFGVTRYPAIFVDDILAATPDDFGFYGKGAVEAGGRYAPLKSAAAHERFRADLSRMIRLVLEGDTDAARAAAAPAHVAAISEWPAVTITDLDGRPVERSALAGRPVVVELWATWCPPCRGTLAWLGDLKKRHRDRLAVVAVSVQSEEPDVRRLVSELKLPFVFAIGTPEIVRAFGDVSAVPTLLLFDGEGHAVATYYGAPPTLHADAEATLAALLK